MTRDKHLTPEHYETLKGYLARTPGVPALCMELQLRTGMREDELVRLTPQSFKWTQGAVAVDPAKGSKPRLVPLSPDFVARRRAEIEGIPKGQTLGAHLANGRTTKATQTRQYRRVVRALYASALGIPEGQVPYSAHSLRHTFALNLLRGYLSKGDASGLLKVQLAMGHRSLSSTAKYLEFLQMSDMAGDILASVG